jgi:flagellar basal-body rod protein FlgF
MANNVANSATQGYKADRELYNLYVGDEAQVGYTGSTSFSPLIDGSWIDFAQGTFQDTDNPLHLALSGRGFLVAKDQDGFVYTRNGTVEVSKNGELLGPDSLPLVGRNNRPVRIDPERTFEVSRDGMVSQNGTSVGQLALVDFAEPGAIIKRDSNYFRQVDPEAKPKRSSTVEVHQGRLESSNVSAAESSVRMVGLMRHFEMLQKAITIGSEMNRRAVQEVARVGR